MGPHEERDEAAVDDGADAVHLLVDLLHGHLARGVQRHHHYYALLLLQFSSESGEKRVSEAKVVVPDAQRVLILVVHVLEDQPLGGEGGALSREEEVVERQ